MSAAASGAGCARLHRWTRRWLALGLVLGVVLAATGCALEASLGAGDARGAGVIELAHGQALAVGAELPAGPPPAAAAWMPVSLPDAWDSTRSGYQGYVWYRLRFATPAGWPEDLAVYLPSVSMNAALRLNGAPIGLQGRLHEPVTRNFYTPLIFPLPRALLRPPGQENELQVLLMGYRQFRSGLAPVYLGPAEPLQRAWAQRRFWQNTGTLITSVLVLALALYGALLWLRARAGGAMYAWFTLAALVWGLRNLNFVLTDNPWSNLWWNELSLAGAAVFVGLFALFTLEYHRWMLGAAPLRRRQLAPPLAYIALALVVLPLTRDTAQLRLIFIPLGLAGLALAAWSQWKLIDAARRVRTGSAWAVALAGLVYLGLLVHDYGVAADREQLGLLFLRQYAALPMFIAVTLAWTRRYWQAFAEVERLSRGLQQQVQAQREALDANYGRLLAVERERVLSQERERLVSDLHDGLGLHLLTALKMARSGEDGAAEPVRRSALADTLQDCLDELRLAIDSMSNIDERDPVLLLASLRFRLAPRLQAAGVQLEWQVHGEVAPQPWLDAPSALHLLRVVQEALTNAVRHGGAARVLLQVEAAGAGVAVAVIDDGRGFDHDAERAGLGLASMRRRAAMIGAQISVDSPAQGGTVVRLLRAVAP